MSIKLNDLQNNFILNNSAHYKESLHYDWKEIIDKYYYVIMEYLKYIFENIKMKNVNSAKYLIIRGLETITHVFRNLLFFTKNLNMTYYNTQRAFYFYFEFIEQISEEQISYLKLNSNDAILYVYKKTIYQINHDYRKSMKGIKEKDMNLFHLFDEYIYLMKTYITNIVYQDFTCCYNEVLVNSIKNKKNEDIIYEINEYYKKIMGKHYENPEQQLKYLKNLIL
jgi:hypothetical protein